MRSSVSSITEVWNFLRVSKIDDRNRWEFGGQTTRFLATALLLSPELVCNIIYGPRQVTMRHFGPVRPARQKNDLMN